MILVLGISYVILMSLPFSIAFFYEKTFKKKAYPFLFLFSAILFLISFLYFSDNFFSDFSSGFLAASGILIAAASLRLYLVMNR